jgi:subtilisin-like proprotein convertase family protein
MESRIDAWDGAEWVPVYTTEAIVVADAAWTPLTYDLSAFGGTATQIRFCHLVGADGAYVVSGWNVDDLSIGPPGCFPTPGQFEAAWLGPISILDNSCGTSAGVSIGFDVTQPFTVTGLTVGLTATHTYRGDIVASLTSPLGTTVSLTAGGAGGIADNIDALFADGAPAIDSVDHDAAAPHYENTWSPSQPLLSFAGEDALGTWTLYVCDQWATDEGTLDGAALFFTP